MMDSIEVYEAKIRQEFGDRPVWPLWKSLLATVGLLAWLLALYLPLRLLPAVPLFAAGLVGTLALVPLWTRMGRRGDWFWFISAKTYTIIVFAGVILLARSDLLSAPGVMRVLIWGFVFVNVAEAVAAELFTRREMGSGSVSNALLGVAVALSFPFSEVGLQPDSVSYPLSMWWIVAYTIWNLSFASHISDGRITLHHVAVLAAPLGVAFFDPAAWVEARVLTLAFFLGTYNTFFPTFFLSYALPPWLRGGARRATVPVAAIGLACVAASVVTG
jgi:hypothetical protein